MIVFSHLRWDFVYQRPQHLLSRLAKYYRIFFVEEPQISDGPPRWDCSSPASNVMVCRPRTAIAAAGFHDEQLSALQTLMSELLEDNDVVKPIVWLYTPMALPLVGGLDPSMLIYDCMDELAAFKNAPRQLVQRERALLKACNLVFTGGASLYEAKRSRHPAVYCLPSSVDRAHFGAACDPSIENARQASLARPRLGFFGVIDERLDNGLLDLLAASHPEWQIIMVGPIVKIDPATLPGRPNLHYYGPQSYADLPSFLAGWDVCLLPFALNDATRYISPTKTLEYMAAGRPIVSTPIADVVDAYQGIVRIGTGMDFVRACEEALQEEESARLARIDAMRNVLSRTSWDETAARMHELIQDQEGADPAERSGLVAGATLPLASEPPIIVIGAGPTGLSAAYHLGEDCLLLEKNTTVGGWCRSIEEGGFTFDYAGHIMFSNDPYVHKLYSVLLEDNVHWQNREAWIYSQGIYTRYPFQGALYGLPASVIAECIIGAVEARVGAAQDIAPAPGRGGSSASACKAESITDCCADGVQVATAPLVRKASRANQPAPRNFEEFIYQVWGSGIAKHFAIPYNRKLWAVPLSSMETSWLGGRVPLPDLKEMIEGALQPAAKPMGPNARFGYPLRGGFQALMNGFLKHLRGPLKTDSRVARVIPSQHQVILSDATVHRYQQLISTMPLPLLVKAAGEEAPPAVRMAAARLRHVSVRCVNLGIDRADVTDKHWIYYPGSTIFHRIFVQGNASANCNAPGGFALTCEITYSPDKPLPVEGDELIDRCIADCIDVGLLRHGDGILVRNQVDMPYAYVVYDHGRADNVEAIRAWALRHDIILAGRYSEWEYYNSDHAFIAGKNAAAKAAAMLDAGPFAREPSSPPRNTASAVGAELLPST